MRKVLTYSALLIIGLVLSQTLPAILGNAQSVIAAAIRVLTMTGLAYIMIHVGFEFHIDKSNLRQYRWDYIVAFTAASFPWVFVTGYFVFVMLPPDSWGNITAWKETLLASRFAAPTSAGVLFSMLAAAGLGATWLYRKARILAVFDDLDTVLLMIPLKMLMVGIAWQLGFAVGVMATMLAIAFIWMHRVRMPVTWGWVVLYAAVIVGVSELLYAWSTIIDPSIPIHIEVLLPAFVLGCIARPCGMVPGQSRESVERSLHLLLEHPREKSATTTVSAVFMVLVGLSMPPIFGGADAQHPAPDSTSLHTAAPASVVDQTLRKEVDALGSQATTITAAQPSLGWGTITLHVLILTLLSNLGKMFPVFCYRREAHWRHRLAVAVGMWPRGEVGAGVLVLSMGYGIGGPIVTVAMLSLALNLALTGLFIMIVKKLTSGVPEEVLPCTVA